jgi:hypothetical protein
MDLALRLLAAAGLALAGCSLRPPGSRPAGEVALIDVGSTVVRRLDGQARRGGPFDVATFEVAPGPHRLALVFTLPARSIGLRALPAQEGIGECVLEFEARAGHRYYLVARPLGDFNSPRWTGDWEAWVRDPTVASDDDVIARCRGAEPAPTPAPAAAPPGAAAAAPDVRAPTPTPLPLPGGRALRVGAWRLPDLARAASADLAATAAAIGAGYDVLAISPALEPDPLLAALGGAWAATRATPDATIFYRRDLVRPCAPPSPAPPCLESIDAAPGSGRPLLIMLPAAEARP